MSFFVRQKEKERKYMGKKKIEKMKTNFECKKYRSQVRISC